MWMRRRRGGSLSITLDCVIGRVTGFGPDVRLPKTESVVEWFESEVQIKSAPTSSDVSGSVNGSVKYRFWVLKEGKFATYSGV